jgi:hypothetical protein
LRLQKWCDAGAMRATSCIALFLIGSISAIGQQVQPQQKKVPDPSSMNLFTISPTLSVSTGTKSQQMYSGDTILSHVWSRAYCDVKTQQFGVVGGASDSITSSNVAPTTPAVDVITNDFGASYQRGILHRDEAPLLSTGGVKTKDDQGRNVRLTRIFLSASADYYMNNSLGLGLQQSYTVGFERYLTACPDAVPLGKDGKPLRDAKGHIILPKPRSWFLAFGVSGGFINERLYDTTPRVQSAILPVSIQGSRIWQGKEVTDANGNTYRNPPKMIFSAQVSYTPLFSDLHSYQLYETTAFTIPTGWANVNLAFTQTDYYLNNAPASFKRNYAIEGVVLTWTLPMPKPPVNTVEDRGACYTVDKSSHVFCYDSIQANGCIAPSVFRKGAMCGANPGIQPFEMSITQEPRIVVPSSLEEK